MAHHLHHHHDPVLATLSLLIAAFASYVALDLANSLTVAQGRARLAWLAGGSLAMGVGIWSMHFVGMLAFQMPGIQIAYDVPLLILSILVSILASALALHIVSRKKVSARAYVLGSFAMGGAIAGMHYIGIAGMKISASYHWNWILVAISLVIALVASFVALLLAFRLRDDMTSRGFLSRVLGGVVMGIAIAGMHYTAMAAMEFYPGKAILIESEELLATDGLATAVICASVLIMGIALTGSVVDRALARREATAAQITRILESITDGFFSVDRNWNFTYVNRVARDAIIRSGGPVQDDYIGACLWNTMVALEGTRLEAQYRLAMRDGVSIQVEEYFEPLSRWFEARAYPSSDGLSVYFRDVTDEKRAQEAIDQARKAAESANKIKSQFIANVSHEIRTPLGAILGFAELAEDSELKADERHSYISGIIRNAKELSRLIGDILDLSKVEADKLDIEIVPLQIQGLLGEVLETFKLKAHEQELELTACLAPDVPETIISDPIRLRQVLINLVGNAVKFTRKGRVEIQGSLLHSNLNSLALQFDVVDTGIGLTSDQVKGLFTPFFQADSSMTRRYGGTGLGLALSRRIARALGGDLWLKESSPTKGSTFSFSFKFLSAETELVRVAEVRKRATSLDSKSNDALVGVSLLLVDDSADNRLVVCRYLAQTGAKVETAVNGREGIQRATTGEFNLVLMDIQMPVMDGFEATAELRKQGFSKPIFALTAHAMKEERERALSNGFDAYLTKPIDRAQLIATIERLGLPQN